MITGASAGIGRAIALAYAAPGVTLGLLARDAQRLDETAALCRERGARVVTGLIDVRDAAAMQVWIEQFDDMHPMDLLVANAGAASTLTHANDWEGLERTAAIVDTNFYGVMHAVLPAVSRMRPRRRGHVVLVSSLAALRGMAISPAYCASKAALKAYGDSVRPLLARDGVRLSVVLPGFVKTAMSDVFPGAKHFLWSADKAARHIRNKVGAGHKEIAFPMPLAIGMRLLSVLPHALADAILKRMSYLPGKEH
jgi:short-subunit dehydrogenase